MWLRGSHIECQVPDDWVESTEGILPGSRLYIGPEGEELVLRCGVLVGGSPAEGLAAVRAAVLAHHLETVRRASVQDGLRPVEPLRKVEACGAVECWAFVSESVSGDEVLMGALAATERGVLLVTLAGPNRSERRDTLQKLLATVNEPSNEEGRGRTRG